MKVCSANAVEGRQRIVLKKRISFVKSKEGHTTHDITRSLSNISGGDP